MTLLVDRLRVSPMWGKIDTSSEDQETVRTWLTQRYVPVYEISNVADFLAQGNAEFGSLTDFPNVAPLHILYWMEWRRPTRVLPLLGPDKTEPERVGICFWQSEPPVDHEWSVSAHAWGMWKDRKNVEPLVSWELTMRTDGTPEVEKTHVYPNLWKLFDRGRIVADAAAVEVPFVESEEHARRLITEFQKRRADLDHEISKLGDDMDVLWENWVRLAVLHPALMAHSLLSCKNVETDDHDPPAALSKKHERKKGQPLVSFKTLRVLPVGGRSRGSGSGDDDLARPLHIVRGHFKTFSKDRPLFGRLTGTYWWASQLRGKAEHGVIVKDYEVKA